MPDAHRREIDLGGSWSFRTDPDDVGLTERWQESDAGFTDQLLVPGAWNVQGVELDPERLSRWEASRAADDQPLRDRGLLGPELEADRQRHVHPGPAWYRRAVTIPADWTADRTELVLDGVQRSARIWVTSEARSTRDLGTVVGAVVPVAIDLTEVAAPGTTVTVTIRVDARRHPEVDPWWGCRDTLDFLFLNWGGLWGPVRLVGSPGHRISSVGVTTSHTAGEVTFTIDIDQPTDQPVGAVEEPLVCELMLIDPDGGVAARASSPVVTDQGVAGASAVLSTAELRWWSPADPYLYQAELQLVGTSVIDRHSVRVGLRDLTVAGRRFSLNGRPFFARGYGDDCIFPDTIAPPHDVEAYRARLLLARDHGFNWVRLHSWVPPEAMLEAADEVGMLVQPELPTGLTWEPPRPETHALVRHRWRELILRYRHHPSVAAWCQGNELYDSHPLAAELYGEAKRLDPGRLVIESDGTRRSDVGRETLDYAVVQFDEGISAGLDDHKYDLARGDVAKPVIAHEVGYFVTLPNPSEQHRFGSGIRPYWLRSAAERIADRGWQDRYPSMLAASRALQRSCLKINTEAIRASDLAGWSHWLLYDYPACAEGIVDMFGGSKGVDPDWFRRVNSDVVVLAPGLARNHDAGTTLELDPLISCWQRELPVDGVLEARLTDSAGAVLDQVARRVRVTEVRQPGPRFRLSLPETDLVTPMTLQLRFVGETVSATNEWDLWSHPPRPASIPTDTPVQVAARWRPDVADQVRAGASVVLLDPTGLFDCSRSAYRPAAWDGAGHFGLVFDPDHPALAPLHAAGWCDERFYRLVDGGTVMTLPVGDEPAVLVRALDHPDRMADRAVLAEYRSGRGRLLVSGFRLDDVTLGDDPAARTVLATLIDYAASDHFRPQVELQ